MKADPDKCHFLCSLDGEVSLTFKNKNTQNSKYEELLAINLGSKLKFSCHVCQISHISDICHMIFVENQDRN